MLIKYETPSDPSAAASVRKDVKVCMRAISIARALEQTA